MEMFGKASADDNDDDVCQLWLYNLLERTLPSIRLKQGPTKTTHTSGHKPIDEEIEGQDLKVLDGLVEFLKEKCKNRVVQSTFLIELQGKQDNYYTSEVDIQTLIGHLLRDIIRLIKLDDVRVVQETYVPHARYLGKNGNKSDFWLICRHQRQPLLIVEVKSPHVANGLSEPSVVGQICDYMIDIASFYGQRDVFGITTNGTEWKFHWFPSCDDTAESTTLTSNSKGKILNDPPPGLSRSVCSTNPISQQDPSLVPLLLSVIFKSLYSPTYKVPLISPDRKYITLSEDSWSWSVLQTATTDLNKLTIDVNHEVDCSTEFVVLNHLARNKDQLVWIALAGSTSRIVVIKQFTQDLQAEADVELSIWQTVNDAHCSIRTIRGLPSLVMPLVIHAQFDENRGIPFFNCDLLYWLFPSGAVPDVLPKPLVLLRKAMMEAGAQWENRVIDAATHAINVLAEHKIVHDDLQWRHFALLPRFINGSFSQFTPVMFDFSMSHHVESKVEARTAMMNNLNVLINNLTTGEVASKAV